MTRGRRTLPDDAVQRHHGAPVVPLSPLSGGLEQLGPGPRRHRRLKPKVIHSFIHSFVHSFIHSFVRSFVSSSIRSFIHDCLIIEYPVHIHSPLTPPQLKTVAAALILLSLCFISKAPLTTNVCTCDDNKPQCVRASQYVYIG